MQTVAPLSVSREPIAETSRGYGGTIDHICMPAIATSGEISNPHTSLRPRIAYVICAGTRRAIWSKVFVESAFCLHFVDR